MWQTIHEVERDGYITCCVIAVLVTGLLTVAALSGLGSSVAVLGGLAVATLALYYLDDVDVVGGTIGLVGLFMLALIIGGLLWGLRVASGPSVLRMACLAGVFAYFLVGGLAVSFARGLREYDGLDEPPGVDGRLRLTASVALAILLAGLMAYAQWPSPFWTPVLALLAFFGFFSAARQLHVGAGLCAGFAVGLGGWHALDNAQFGAFIGVLAFFGGGRILKVLLQNLFGRHDSPT